MADGLARLDFTADTKLRFFEIARVFVRLDHVASVIVNADDGIM